MEERAETYRAALLAILAMTKSHVDGRDLLAELHPRKTLDIKRRVDGVETWFEGDWLSSLRDATAAATIMLGADDKLPPHGEAHEWALNILRANDWRYPAKDTAP